MISNRVSTLIVLLAAICVAASTAPSAAQVRVPADFQFEQGKDSPAPVTFSHEKHRAKLEKCNACHTKIFKMKKGADAPITMAKMKAGEQCGACHNGKTEVAGVVPVSVEDTAKCETCHRK